jgi:hypothetical protein
MIGKILTDLGEDEDNERRGMREGRRCQRGCKLLGRNEDQREKLSMRSRWMRQSSPKM